MPKVTVAHYDDRGDPSPLTTIAWKSKSTVKPTCLLRLRMECTTGVCPKNAAASLLLKLLMP